MPSPGETNLKTLGAPGATELICVSDSFAFALIGAQLSLVDESAVAAGCVKKAPEAQQDEQHR